MRKPERLISYILIMAIMVCSTAPVFAEAWTSTQATQTNQAVRVIEDILSNFWETAAGSSAPVLYSWQDFMYEFNRFSEFLVPRGSWQGQTSLWDIINNSLPGIYSYINGYFGNFNTQLTNQTNYLSKLDIALDRQAGSYTENWPRLYAYQVGHYRLFRDWDTSTSDSDIRGDYYFGQIKNNGTYDYQNRRYYWQDGTPLGNIALMLQQLNNNIGDSYSYRWIADLKHYNDNLTTWDSQGDTLQQVAFTPESAIQGLYRYLAFTQRDVARLTYVLASDEEITAREKARDNQNAVLDNFIDDTGDGSISTNDFGSVADASKDIKNNLNTGVSANGIFDVFTGDHTSAWFSQTTAHELDRTQANRSLLKANGLGVSEYDTPLLDEKMVELLSIFGGDDKND